MNSITIEEKSPEHIPVYEGVPCPYCGSTQPAHSLSIGKTGGFRYDFCTLEYEFICINCQQSFFIHLPLFTRDLKGVLF